MIDESSVLRHTMRGGGVGRNRPDRLQPLCRSIVPLEVETRGGGRKVNDYDPHLGSNI